MHGHRVMNMMKHRAMKEHRAMQESEARKEFCQRAWDYFELHAAQRLTTFNFYVVLSSLIASALFTVFSSGQPSRLGWLLSILLLFLSFVFWKLDGRNRDLIDGAEVAIKYFEANPGLKLENKGNEPHVAKIFTREEYATKLKKQTKSIFLWNRYLGYRNCFNIIFAGFGLAGLAGLVGMVLSLW